MKQIKVIEECFRRLFYDLGEKNWTVIKLEAWDKYVNNNESFTEAQLKDLQDHYNDLLSELEEVRNETIIYAFQYNPSLYESGFITRSLHKTYKTAEIAMEKHKQEVKEDFDSWYEEDPNALVDMKWDDLQLWRVQEFKLEE